MYLTKKLWEIVKISKWKKVNYQDENWKYNYIDIWILRTWKVEQFTNDEWIFCKKEDILIAWDGSKSWTVWFWLEWVIGSTLAKLEIQEKEIFSKFLWVFLQSKFIYLNTNTSWAAIPHLRKDILQNLPIPLPPLHKQQKIVSKLDSLFEKLDQAITLTKQNLVNIEELNKSVLEKIFKECEEKYEKREIQDFSEVKSWKRLPKWEKVESFNTWYPYIRVTDFLDTWTINLNTVMYISEKNFNTICNYIITKDDLYISIAWTIWKTWIIPEKLNWANLTENAVRLVYKDKDKIFNKYIYYFTLSENFKNQAWLATRAVAMPKLAISRLKQISIPLPPLPEQQKIVEYLDNIFAKNKILQEKYKQDLKNFEELKQSILKQAFEDEDFIK